MRSVPAPWRATATDAQLGQRLGTASRWPQWWQAMNPPLRCSTSATSQFGHIHTRPHDRQERKFDQPRRFSSTIALPPLRRQSASASRVSGCSGWCWPRMSRTSTGGSGRPSIRRRRRRRGVDDGSRAGAWRCRAAARRRDAAGPVLGHRAGVVARVALVLVGALVLLVDDHQADVRQRREHGRARPDSTRAPRRCASAATRRSARPVRAPSASPRRRRRSAPRSGEAPAG